MGQAIISKVLSRDNELYLKIVSLSQISASFDSCKWLLMYETMIFIPWALGNYRQYNICLFCLCDCAIHLFSL